MVIQHNIAALNVYRNIQTQQNIISKSLLRLSSGYKINSAADDPAGLGISENMRAQIRGLKVASQNAQQAVSMLQTAEGGLNEVHDILQRMRELAVQSSNGTYSDDDRAMLSKEYEALKDEIDRISGYTNYNEIKLLDGSAGGEKGEKGLQKLGLEDGSISVTGEAEGIGRFDFRGDKAGGYYATLQLGVETYYARAGPGDGNVGFDLGEGNSVTVSFDPGKLRDGVLTNVEFTGDGANISRLAGADSKSMIWFQVGANGSADQRIGVHIDNMSSVNLGFVEEGRTVSASSILTREDAKDAIEVLDKGINLVSSQRGAIGAVVNRLGHTINNLENTMENLQAAESSIRDADMAEEMMNFVKHNILLQAAQAVMAHAMQQPDWILSLLR